MWFQVLIEVWKSALYFISVFPPLLCHMCWNVDLTGMSGKERAQGGFLQAAQNNSMYVGEHVCVCVHTLITSKYMQFSCRLVSFKDVNLCVLNVISEEDEN